MNNPKDFIGTDIYVGDEVIFITPKYRSLTKGKIDRVTKCYIIVKYFVGEHEYEIKQKPEQLVKVVYEHIC